MAEQGIGLLITCVHPHHGYVPLHKRHALFDWEVGGGRKMRVVLSDHYHTGNELGLAPGAECNYSAGFSDVAGRMDDDVLNRRLPDYLKRVEEAGWAHDFLVVGVSGMLTDNAPPSAAVAARIARWNAAHPGGVHIEMTTPTALAGIVGKAAVESQAGDWPDWWSDGVAGDPEAVALFRLAQRQRRYLAALPAGNRPAAAEMEKLDDPLGYFAEHTFGHSAAMSDPWNLLAQQLRLRKLGYAAEAADQAEAMIDAADESMNEAAPAGGGVLAYDRPLFFRIFNPFEHPVRSFVELEVDGSETARWGIVSPHVRVIDRKTGQVVPHQVGHALRGIKVVVDQALGAHGSVELAIESVAAKAEAGHKIVLPDGSYDVPGDRAAVLPTDLRTEHVGIEWSAPEEISGWRDLKTGKDLIDRSAGVLPFTLVSSRLHAGQDGEAQCAVRKRLGRNRNGADAVWSRSRLKGVRRAEEGALHRSVELDYAMEGCEHVRLILRAWKDVPRVDVELLVNKVGTWDAENVYLALPFTAGAGAEVYLDRGTPVRPGVDQIPGTLVDYFGVQDGVASCAGDYGVAIAQWDSHLIQVGPLGYGVRQFSSGAPAATGGMYAWLMTNFWETNFSPEVGGFYSFRFGVQWGKGLAKAGEALAACRDVTTPLRVMRVGG